MKAPEGRVHWLTRAEESLCRAARKQRNGTLLVDFIHLAVNADCRKEEMPGLEWRRVDLVNRLIYLEGRHTKAGKRRSIPLNEGAMDALKGRMAYQAMACPGSPWVFARATGNRVTCIRRGFISACKSARIDDFVIHDLRHTCAAHLISAGGGVGGGSGFTRPLNHHDDGAICALGAGQDKGCSDGTGRAT